MDSSRENKQLDELFKSKLEGYDSPVGEELWDRLNKERLSKARPAWYERKVLAAAVVAAVLVAGGIWLSLPAGKETLSASESGEVPGISRETAYEAAPSPGPDSTGPEYAVASGASDRTFSDAAKVVPGAADTPAGEITRGKNDSKGRHSEPFSPVDEGSRETVQVVAGPAPVAEKETKEEQGGTRVLIVYVSPPVSSVDAAPEKPGYELTVVESHENEAPEGRKKLSFKRFFKQLKNAKTGEKIDWEELGLNPQRVFANVDHSGQGQVRDSGGQ